jgi:glycine cleavage system transcriptional repressor
MSLILTAVGIDRPGLVADLTQHVHAAGASLADSRMVNLRGHFALLALVEGADADLAKLKSELGSQAKSIGLRIEFDEAGETAKPAMGGVPYRLKTYSMDQPGIVARLSDLLRRHEVNVEELETRVESAPFAGTPLFLLEAVVTLPKGKSLRALRDDLHALGDAMGCDVDIDPA